jgi:hypothetical protein
MARLGQKVVARCAERGRSFRGGAIVLDENGRVSDVRAANDSEEAAEARRCVLAALGGLRFPCLAGMQVCPEWVIVE